MDLSLILAIFAIVLAGLSPFLTYLINNRHELKMYHLKFYEAHRTEVIEDYLKTTSEAICNADVRIRNDYRKAYAEIFMYTDSKIWEKLRALDSLISGHLAFQDSNKHAIAETSFAEIIKYLSENNKPREHKADKRHSKGNK